MLTSAVAASALMSTAFSAPDAAPGARTMAPATSASMPVDAKRLSHGRFRDFPVYQPAAAPTSFVLFLSGDEGWNSTADAMASASIPCPLRKVLASSML